MKAPRPPLALAACHLQPRALPMSSHHPMTTTSPRASCRRPSTKESLFPIDPSPPPPPPGGRVRLGFIRCSLFYTRYVAPIRESGDYFTSTGNSTIGRYVVMEGSRANRSAVHVVKVPTNQR